MRASDPTGSDHALSLKEIAGAIERKARLLNRAPGAQFRCDENHSAFDQTRQRDLTGNIRMRNVLRTDAGEAVERLVCRRSATTLRRALRLAMASRRGYSRSSPIGLVPDLSERRTAKRQPAFRAGAEKCDESSR